MRSLRSRWHLWVGAGCDRHGRPAEGEQGEQLAGRLRVVRRVEEAVELRRAGTKPLGGRAHRQAGCLEARLCFEGQSVQLQAGEVRDRLGAPISGYDAQIAAICRVHGATLATRNVKDFDHVGIDVVNPWTDG
jgi:predicted nucleic acid-binding protein